MVGKAARWPGGPGGPVGALGLVAALILEVFRPVALEKPRQRSVGEELPAGLASRAVVAFVVGVDNPLHRRTADRAWLFEASVDRHRFAERRHLFWEPPAGLSTQSINPFQQRAASIVR